MAVSLKSLQRNRRKPPRIIVYGPEGIGKNTFAICQHAPESPESPPGPARPGVVVIQTEDGLGDIDCLAFPLAKSYEEVDEYMGTVYQEAAEQGINTLVIDSLDWLEPLIWDKACRENGWKSIEDAGYGKGYIAADALWRQFFSNVNLLRDELDMTVIMTAHQQIVKVEDPELQAYDSADIKLHKRAAAIANENSDVILRASLKTMFTTDPSASKSAIKQGDARKLAVSTGQRIISTQPKPGAKAKNRYHLPAELPLDWSAFEAAMNASLARAPA